VQLDGGRFRCMDGGSVNDADALLIAVARLGGLLAMAEQRIQQLEQENQILREREQGK
jgi:hypothetical protein